jgi:hypothetical protein
LKKGHQEEHAMNQRWTLYFENVGRIDKGDVRIAPMAYRNHPMGPQLPDPILIKQNIDDSTLAQTEWVTGKVNLPELGQIILRRRRRRLDEATGIGQYAIA